MAVKKVEIKVDVNCEKCKYAILGAVTELEGVNLVSLDHEKQLLTVVGTMDAVCIAEHLMKIKQSPVIVSIGPPKPPVKPPPVVCYCIPPSCNRSCNRIPPYCTSGDLMGVEIYDKSSCTIV